MTKGLGKSSPSTNFRGGARRLKGDGLNRSGSFNQKLWIDGELVDASAMVDLLFECVLDVFLFDCVPMRVCQSDGCYCCLLVCACRCACERE